MHLRLDGTGSLTRQLVHAIREAVRGGSLAPGRRLPSSRDLARTLGVSRNVVLAAFEQLGAEGYLTAHRGAGTFVADGLAYETPRPGARSAHAPRLSAFAMRLGERYRFLPPFAADDAPAATVPFDFRYGQVAFAGVARKTWSRLLGRFGRGADATRPAPVEGLGRLRAAIAEHLRYTRGVRADADAVFVTHGVQDAFDRCARLLLEPGRRVVLEDPHYPAARGIALAHGARVDAVPVDPSGMDTARLPRARNALAYLTPSHQFPLGGVLSLSRRQDLLRWAARHDAIVFEDDYDSQFRYDVRPLESLASLDRDRVVYAGSFSKTIAPGLRLGYVVLPDSLVEPFRRMSALVGSGTALFVQQSLAAFVSDGYFARHLRHVGRDYAARRAALLSAAGRHLGQGVTMVGTEAGVHVVLRFLDRTAREARTVTRRLRDAGVAVNSIEALYLDGAASRPLELLLGYGSTTPEQIDRGIRHLAAVIGGRDAR